MKKRGQRVIHLHQSDPQEALERLNRVTGLSFKQWPESLLAHVEPQENGGEAVVEPTPVKVQPG